MKSLKLAVVSLGLVVAFLMGECAIAAGSSYSATAQIVLILPPNIHWQQSEVNDSRELCLWNMPTKHVSISAFALEEQQSISLGSNGCLSETELKGFSQLIIIAE